MSGVSRETQCLITREDCVLVVIDVQEKLVPVISNKERVVENVIKLSNFAQIIGMPVILTEQTRLGLTIPEVRKGLSHVQAISKVHFNCFFCKEFSDEIEKTGKKTLIVTGVEAHICVTQTALYALPDLNVHIISDAVSSRTPENCRVALERMGRAGAVITSTEMFIYELLQKAGTDEFKAVLQLVR
ncbi:MAG: isochorismatase family protein [Proteobacteria bacterium]|nr:isochorismatase family protein [Pseudomonadota bacterium]